jgi:hypothetical protein
LTTGLCMVAKKPFNMAYLRQYEYNFPVPRRPDWIHLIPEVIEELERLPCPVVDRAAVERLLGVSARQALRIVSRLGGFPAGRNLVVERTALVEALRRYGEKEDVAIEGRRRVRIEEQLARLRGELGARRVRIEATDDVWERRFGDLPEGIQFERGALRVEFRSGEDLLRKLLELSQAIANDYGRFEELVTSAAGS